MPGHPATQIIESNKLYEIVSHLSYLLLVPKGAHCKFTKYASDLNSLELHYVPWGLLQCSKVPSTDKSKGADIASQNLPSVNVEVQSCN